MIRLATDVGGTFTDLVGYDEGSGEIFTAKSLTTSDNQSGGVLDAIDVSERKDGLRVRDITFFAHGGTTVINAITERKGQRPHLSPPPGSEMCWKSVVAIGRTFTICISIVPNLSCLVIFASRCVSGSMRPARCSCQSN